MLNEDCLGLGQTFPTMPEMALMVLLTCCMKCLCTALGERIYPKREMLSNHHPFVLQNQNVINKYVGVKFEANTHTKSSRSVFIK